LLKNASCASLTLEQKGVHMSQTDAQVSFSLEQFLLEEIPCASSTEMQFMKRLIRAVPVTQDYDALIDAWILRCKKAFGGPEDLGVPAILLAQKLRVKPATVTKERYINELEVGEEFFDTGGLEFGTRFRKTGPNMYVAFSGGCKGQIFRRSELSILVHQIIKG